MCLGSCAFLWGFKSEASPTWYGIFLSDGTKVAAVDTMSELWTGHPVPNPCPRINSLKLTSGDARVDTGTVVHVQLDAASGDDDPITVSWELQRDLSRGANDGAASAPAFPEAIIGATDKGADVKMPSISGGYRLFAYVRTAHSGSAVANLCLFVNSPAAKPTTAKTTVP
jgi:hypothetical protein